MNRLHAHCCGLDVHKDSIVACVLHSDGRREVRTFQTTTREILRLGDWLRSEGVTIVAMESTGVYWKPIWNLLEGSFELLLVNAQHVKRVPGRKTDVSDSEWLAELLQYGLLRSSLVPDCDRRDLRDLTRTRRTLMEDRARVVNRIQKVLEDANIKLGSVATDVLGVSGRAMLEALIEGTSSPEQMAELAKSRMRSKIPQLREALSGRVRPHHAFLLRSLLEQVDHLDEQVAAFDARIEEQMGPSVAAAVERLDGIPGFDRRGAQSVLAEIGTDMSRFPTDRHLCSWATTCPGNRESGGKRQSGRTRKGNRWLKATLVQAAWAASRKSDSYFKSQYARLAARRGKKRAVLAVANALLTVIYHVLRDGTEFTDLGAMHFDRIKPERHARSLVKRLNKLGYRVTLEKESTLENEAA